MAWSEDMIHLRRIVDTKSKGGGGKLLAAIELREFHWVNKENTTVPKFLKVKITDKAMIKQM